MSYIDHPTTRAYLDRRHEEAAFDPRVSGKNFSPSEQRALIDEEGEARNLHRLEIGDTHYELDEFPDLIGW